MWEFNPKLYVYRQKYKIQTGLTKHGITMQECDHIFDDLILDYSDKDVTDVIMCNTMELSLFHESEVNAIYRTIIDYNWGDVKHNGVKL